MQNNKYIIETGIGLQDVDHLKNSSYYKSKPDTEIRTEEADKISIRIGELLGNNIVE